MRFLADESVERKVGERLKEEGFEVLFVADIATGLPDEAVLALALQQDAVLITADKDFGELIFRRQLPHKGVLLLRLSSEMSSERKAEIVCQMVKRHSAELWGAFVVVSELGIRFRKPMT
ncbi:MAG: DUF5615 family PIN-like protein [Armatimonadetes bacterium]|nr:DUF5615 family PIN-like protein [Armatimonadota bacterium]MDW8027621.1 DUF5615 family PIN-like protein [Armatimonadota bacterium]